LLEAGKELLAADIVESVNNVLKRVAEAALYLSASTRDAVASASSLLRDAGGQYAKGVGKGLIKAATRQGPKDGEMLFRWFRRVAIGGTFGLGPLLATYPHVFGGLLLC